MVNTELVRGTTMTTMGQGPTIIMSKAGIYDWKKQLENLIPIFLRSSIWCERSKLPRRWNSTSLKPALCNFLEKGNVCRWQNKRYFDCTWVNGQYRISQGNYYDYHGPRTNNNHVEGWHLWLKKTVGKPHPNIFEIIDMMWKKQATTEMKLNQFEAGAMQLSWKRKCVQRDVRLSTLFERFQNGGAT